MTKEWREKSKEADGVVDEEVIAEVVSKMTGVPLKRLGDDETAPAAQDGGRAAQRGRQPARGDQGDRQGGAARAAAA